MRFSQREGHTPPSKAIQVDGMDKDLRNSIWNCIVKCYFVTNEYVKMTEVYSLNKFYNDLWSDFFKLPINDLSLYVQHNENRVRQLYEKLKWYEIYDFIEFIVDKFVIVETNNEFMELCSVVFSREMSAYRFIGGKIMRSTTELEIEEIENALTNTDTDKFLPVKLHLKQSLELMTDRKKPDFRNSIKESISSVESLCKIVLNQPKATLGQALKQLEQLGHISIHPSLKESFSKLYGYTSDADGIRHALLDEANLSFDDAKYFLVSCTAFVNYIISKIPKHLLE